MVVNGRPLKRMKRRITVDLNDFLTFPATDDDFSGEYDGPFRSNVQSFLTKYAQLPPPSSLFPHLLNWQIVLRIGELTDGSSDSSPAVVTLDVLEEDVTRSRSVYCDQCRVVGWSGHPVCGKRYHFIIRTGDSSIEGYHKPCPSCGDVLHLSDSSCKSCNYVVSSEELEEWVQLQLEATTHLLHGVVHGNGYGHLLRVNGREGGSKYLSGCDIMNFWDRICTTLRVRKISVMDVSKKYGMEYRLVHAVTNGHPWYGNWGYEFGSGSFALTLDAYQKAVGDISNIPLSLFFSQARNSRTHLQDIISFYQSLSDSELLTTRDLFCFLMRQIRHDLSSSAVSASKKPGSFSSWTLCSWTIDDVNRVEEGMIKVLQAVGMYRWVSWRSLKGALYRTASPELLDYCLKQLGGKIVGDAMIHARCNTKKNLFEYRLVPSCGTLSDEDTLKNCPTVDQFLGDLKFLYDSLLNPHTMINYRPNKTRDRALCSAAKLLDCKHFVKNYKPEEIPVRNPFVVLLSCEVELIDHPKDYTAPPSELILLPCNSTLTDMKTEATKAFQDVYVIFKRFQVEDVIQCPTKCPTNGLIWVRGRCHEKHGLDQFRMERGIENWTVSCSCGAKDDDGERMLACDACGVWQHTRCAGINDIDAVPESFICRRCDSPMKEASKIDPSECVSRACKEMGAQVMVPGSCRIGGKKLMVPFGVS